MQNIITLDIETLPTDDPEVIAKLSAEIKPPAQYKKADSIDKWMEENFDSELKARVAKTSLDAAYGRIACIAFSDSKIDNCIFVSSVTDDESRAIADLYNIIGTMDNVTLCGHYISSFDLPFLYQRSIILGIKPPAPILKAMKAKPWDECIDDTHLMWTNDKNKHIKLDTLCWVLGIKHGSPDFDGSMVADTWKTDPQRVIKYCADDVRATYEVYQKLTFGDTVF